MGPLSNDEIYQQNFRQYRDEAAGLNARTLKLKKQWAQDNQRSAQAEIIAFDEAEFARVYIKTLESGAGITASLEAARRAAVSTPTITVDYEPPKAAATPIVAILGPAMAAGKFFPGHGDNTPAGYVAIFDGAQYVKREDPRSNPFSPAVIYYEKLAPVKTSPAPAVKKPKAKKAK